MKFSCLILCAHVIGAIATPSVDTPYSTRMANSFISRGIPRARGYSEAVIYEGVRYAYEINGNSSLFSWYHTELDGLVSSTGQLIGWDSTKYSLDDIRIGNNLIYMWNATGRKEEKFKTAATALRKQLDSYPRTPSGGFWHRDPVYKNQMWLDGIYMAQPFYATYTQIFQPENITAWEDIILQFDLIEAHCRNKTSGLLVHGYDEGKQAVWADPVTGACPHVWDRAVGWYFMALVDVLMVYPETLPGCSRLRSYLNELAAGVKKSQDTSGGWWLVMDEPYPGKAGNYIESSATAMFTYGFLKGIRKGLLSSADYLDTAKKAYNLMTSRFVKENADGTLNWEGTVQVGSLSGNGTYEYYISVPVVSNDYKGAGPFIYASYEIELLGN